MHSSRQKVVTVAEIMTTDVICVAPNVPAKMAISAMALNHIRHLVVTSENRVVGVLSQRDVLAFLARQFNQGASPANCPVDSFMVSNVVTTLPTTSISSLAKLMVEDHIGCLPVVDEDGYLVGIVTRTDILKHVGGVKEFNSLLV